MRNDGDEQYLKNDVNSMPKAIETSAKWKTNRIDSETEYWVRQKICPRNDFIFIFVKFGKYVFHVFFVLSSPQS